MGGLCVAIGLLKYSHLKVQIYEAAHHFSEIGAGVVSDSATSQLEIWAVQALISISGIRPKRATCFATHWQIHRRSVSSATDQ